MLIISSDFGYVSNISTLLPLYVFTSQVAVVKSCHGISVKWSPYRAYRPIHNRDPTLFNNLDKKLVFYFGMVLLLEHKKKSAEQPIAVC